MNERGERISVRKEKRESREVLRKTTSRSLFFFRFHSLQHFERFGSITILSSVLSISLFLVLTRHFVLFLNVCVLSDTTMTKLFGSSMRAVGSKKKGKRGVLPASSLNYSSPKETQKEKDTYLSIHVILYIFLPERMFLLYM